MPPRDNIIPLHRQPRDYAGPRIIHTSPPPEIIESERVDMGEWLDRGRLPWRKIFPFRAFAADLRDNADILTFGLTVGICIGALATVGFALLWSAL